MCVIKLMIDPEVRVQDSLYVPEFFRHFLSLLLKYHSKAVKISNIKKVNNFVHLIKACCACNPKIIIYCTMHFYQNLKKN